MSKAEEAVRLHGMGCNCCQAVVCAFADETGMDKAVLYKLGEGFGAGMGTGLGVCGALSGAVMLAGICNSDGDTEHPAHTKAATMKIAAGMQRDFSEKAKRIICREIKTGDGGKAFTSCDDCIRIAAEIAEKTLNLSF